MKLAKIFVFIIFSIILINSSILLAQEVVDPQVLEEQRKLFQKIKENKYRDIEFDHLHLRIKKTLTYLKKALKTYDKIPNTSHKDRKAFIFNDKENNKKYFVLTVAKGESIKAVSERYLYNGDLYIETDASYKELKSLRLQFVRMNPLGFEFKEERRDLVNPTPKLHIKLVEHKEKIDQADPNDDLEIVYFERFDRKKKFKAVSKFKIEEIEYFYKRLAMLEAYKKFIRLATRKVEKIEKDYKTHEKYLVRKMLELR